VVSVTHANHGRLDPELDRVERRGRCPLPERAARLGRTRAVPGHQGELAKRLAAGFRHRRVQTDENRCGPPGCDVGYLRSEGETDRPFSVVGAEHDPSGLAAKGVVDLEP
jgi:hypothetical protein